MRTPRIFPLYRRELRAELEAILGQAELGLYPMVRYQLGLVDEEGRPRRRRRASFPALLCLASCRAAGGDHRRALPAAAALELGVAFLQLHRSLWRAGLPPAWRRGGPAQAINAGDAMYALARLSLLRLQSSEVASSQVSEALGLLDRAFLRACQGREAELSLEERSHPQAADYLEMVQDREGALLQCSLELGGLLGGGDPALARHLGELGLKLGLAHHLRRVLRAKASGLLRRIEDVGPLEEEAQRYSQEALSLLEAAPLTPSGKEALRQAAAFALHG